MQSNRRSEALVTAPPRTDWAPGPDWAAGFGRAPEECRERGHDGATSIPTTRPIGRLDGRDRVYPDRVYREAYLKMLTTRAITSPRRAREAIDSMAIVSFAQRASGITSVGLTARPSVIPR